MEPLPPHYSDRRSARDIVLIAESYRRLLGRDLVAPGANVAEALWNAPVVIVAHRTEADPLLFFANRRALEVFEAGLDAIIGMPSRLTAEPVHRDERAGLMERVRREGFIEDYAGIRISAKGRRFRIEQAVVWNLVDEHDTVHGQAAAFDRWVDL